ncbi:hypothetical protein BH23ACT10_BH23ACT10_13940 [soil metagenome]
MNTRPQPWIGEIQITDDVEHKLASKHGVSRQDVEEAFLYRIPQRAYWHVHELYGERVIVQEDPLDGRRTYPPYWHP